MNKLIPFNKPFISNIEIKNIKKTLKDGKISGNGNYTKLCQDFFENKYLFNKCLLTTSCTDALEISALLLNITAGDEIIMPSYTFVSTANPFILRGANIIFADSKKHEPNIDEGKIEKLITKNTKAIVVVHYGGVSCDMDKIMQIAKKNNLFVVEDAAQAIDSYYKGKPLGSFGDLAAFSFHETKNIISGEGGMIVVNNRNLIKRAEIIWEKGTNRSSFLRGEINKYGWVDIGSSFLPSEIISAFLFGQLQNLDYIQSTRKKIWEKYYSNLLTLEEKQKIKLPKIPIFATNNAHIFYIICNNKIERIKLSKFLRKNNIEANFHYIPLHSSTYFKNKYKGEELKNCNHYADCLLRLPLYVELTIKEVNFITETIYTFYK